MKKEDLFVSVAAPLHNSAAYVTDFVHEVSDVLRSNYANFELVLVDDGSDDDTVPHVQAVLPEVECLRLIRLSRVFGIEIAVTAGMESSIGDYVVIMEPDTDPPSRIPEIVEKCREGIGVMTGISTEPKSDSQARKMFSTLFHWYTQRFLHVDLTPGATEFRVLSRQAVNAVTQIKDRYRQLRMLTATVGYRKYTFEYEPIHRTGTVKSRSLWEDFTDAIEIVVANSMHPLRVVSRLGLLAGALNLLYLCYVVAVYFVKQDVMEGWTTLSFQQGGMFFLVFCILTALCEYTGRILEETRNRPLYFITEELDSSVLLSDETRRNVVRESRSG